MKTREYFVLRQQTPDGSLFKLQLVRETQGRGLAGTIRTELHASPAQYGQLYGSRDWAARKLQSLPNEHNTSWKGY